MMTSLGRKDIYSRVHVCLLHIVISDDYYLAEGSTSCSSTHCEDQCSTDERERNPVTGRNLRDIP